MQKQGFLNQKCGGGVMKEHPVVYIFIRFPFQSRTSFSLCPLRDDASRR